VRGTGDDVPVRAAMGGVIAWYARGGHKKRGCQITHRLERGAALQSKHKIFIGK
jgi:hypothetical protein